MMSHLRCRSLIVMLLLLSVLSGCGGSAAPAATSAPAAASVTVQLAWTHNVEYSGFYMAEEKGYFSSENLNVAFKERVQGSPATSVIDAVVAGDAQFGISSVDNILLARAAGKPVVAIATIYQRSPIAYISLAENNILRPQDMVGRTITMSPKGTSAIVLQAMLTSQGLDPATVTIVDRKDFSNTPLTDGSVDLMGAFINNQPISLQEEGYKINAILPSDYGIEFYSNLIFTTEDMIKNNPEVVERFLRASLQGIDATLDSPEEAAKLSVARNEKLNLAFESKSLTLGLPLLKPAGTNVGMMSAEHWTLAHDFMLKQELLKAALPVDQAFTLQFLQKLYGAE